MGYGQVGAGQVGYGQMGAGLVSLAPGLGLWVNWQAGEGAQALGACRSSRFLQHQLLGVKQQLPSPSFKSKGWVGTQRLLPTLTPGQGFAREEDLVPDGAVSEGVWARAEAQPWHLAQGPQPGATQLSHTSRCVPGPEVWEHSHRFRACCGVALDKDRLSQTAPWAPGSAPGSVLSSQPRDTAVHWMRGA